MSVLINKKRCDNADVCPCIEECPVKAFSWDEENKTVVVDNNLCINCRQCMIACEAGAVKVARNEEEYQKIKTEYDEDIMTVENLFQDRYGASIIEGTYSLDITNLEQLNMDSNKLLLIEFYNEEEARCLVNSIPINEIISVINKPLSYRKINLTDLELLKKYEINELPSLLMFEKGEIIFKYEGFVDVKEKEKLLNEIKTF
jgi:Fe-S-cluster-containing hydrogenase components 1